MTAVFTNPGDGTLIVTFSYQSQTNKLQAALEGISEHVYTDYPIYDLEGSMKAWDALTAQEKLNVVDRYVQKTLISTAKLAKADAASKTARESVPEDSIG